MKAATLSELKKDLQNMPADEVVELCLRLGRFKKENKELLTYLLFEAVDEEAYISGIKEEVNQHFKEINYSNIYFAKKSMRKILRIINKYVRYSGIKQTEVELLIFYCEHLKNSPISIQESAALTNLYNRLVEKIKKTLGGLHEDLQFDYQDRIENLQH